MLQPSFALVKRHEQDQNRVDDEKERRLQHQFEQVWLRIGRLETRAQKSDADKATLERLLREVVQAKLTLEGRVKRLEENAAYVQRRLDKSESDKAVLEYRLEALEKHQDHRRTAHSSTSPETAITSARSTPNATTNQEAEHVYAFNTAGLDPVKLHSSLPSVLFVIDPETSVLSDDSDFSLSLLSSLRSTLAESMAEERIAAKRLETLLINNPFTTKEKCLFRYLEKSAESGRKTVWTREHEHFYACKACVNKQRLCMTVSQGQLLVLPLHPLFRAASNEPSPLDWKWSEDTNSNKRVRPGELQYWIAAKGSVTRHLPHGHDVWSGSFGYL